MTEPAGGMKDLLKSVAKDCGTGVLSVAADARADSVPRISTGIFWLDVATGGGIPSGRMTMIYGRRSAGKSTLAAKIAAHAQRMCRVCRGSVVFEDQEGPRKIKEVDENGAIVEVERIVRTPVAVDCENKCRLGGTDGTAKRKSWPGRMKILWCDAERVFDLAYNRQIFDCDGDDVWLLTPTSGEQAADIIDGSIRTTEVDLVVVDSLAMLIPMKERDDSAEQMHMALQARLVNRAIQTWNSSMTAVANAGQTACSMVLLNQLRDKIGIFPIEIRPAGRAQEFYSSVEIRLKQDARSIVNSMGTDHRPLWQMTEFKVEKNKVSCPYMEGSYRQCLVAHKGRKPGDTWEDEVIIHAVMGEAMRRGFSSRKGGVTVIGRKFDGEDTLAEAVRSDPSFAKVLRSSMLALFVYSQSDGELAKKKKDDD